MTILVVNLQACQSPDRVLFVTTTRLGVGYDLATTTGHVGYERAELYIGPDYPQTGAIPPVAASLRSDLAFIAPSVSQLYATGAAAEKVTSNETSPGTEPDANWDKEGRKVAIVGTHTHVGLIVRADNAAVSQLDFGYGREEASLLPLRDSVNSGKDIYPSTLAAISVETRSSGTDAGLALSQFIATGGAARNLAVRDEFKKAFSDAATEARLSAEYACDENCTKIRAYVNANPTMAPDLVKAKCLTPDNIALPTDLYFSDANADARSKCVQALGIM